MNWRSSLICINSYFADDFRVDVTDGFQILENASRSREMGGRSRYLEIVDDTESGGPRLGPREREIGTTGLHR